VSNIIEFAMPDLLRGDDFTAFSCANALMPEADA
jgi:hypothetical protein